MSLQLGVSHLYSNSTLFRPFPSHASVFSFCLWPMETQSFSYNSSPLSGPTRTLGVFGPLLPRAPCIPVRTKFIFTRSPLNDFDHHLTPRCHWSFQRFYFRRHDAMQLSSRTGMCGVCAPCHCAPHRGKRGFFCCCPKVS